MLEAHRHQVAVLRSELERARAAVPASFVGGAGADGMSVGATTSGSASRVATPSGSAPSSQHDGGGGGSVRDAELADDEFDDEFGDDELLRDMRREAASLRSPPRVPLSKDEDLKYSSRAVGGGKGPAALGVPPLRYDDPTGAGDAAGGDDAAGSGGAVGDGIGGPSRDPLGALTSAPAALTSRLLSRPPPTGGDGLPADAAPIAPPARRSSRGGAVGAAVSAAVAAGAVKPTAVGSGRRSDPAPDLAGSDSKIESPASESALPSTAALIPPSLVPLPVGGAGGSVAAGGAVGGLRGAVGGSSASRSPAAPHTRVASKLQQTNTPGREGLRLLHLQWQPRVGHD